MKFRASIWGTSLFPLGELTGAISRVSFSKMFAGCPNAAQAAARLTTPVRICFFMLAILIGFVVADCRLGSARHRHLPVGKAARCGVRDADDKVVSAVGRRCTV